MLLTYAKCAMDLNANVVLKWVSERQRKDEKGLSLAWLPGNNPHQSTVTQTFMQHQERYSLAMNEIACYTWATNKHEPTLLYTFCEHTKAKSIIVLGTMNTWMNSSESHHLSALWIGLIREGMYVDVMCIWIAMPAPRHYRLCFLEIQCMECSLYYTQRSKAAIQVLC